MSGYALISGLALACVQDYKFCTIPAIVGRLNDTLLNVYFLLIVGGISTQSYAKKVLSPTQLYRLVMVS